MTPQHQSLDIIALVSQTYRRLWQERAYLLRISMIPMAIIALNFMIVLWQFHDATLLRRGLLLLPGMAAEAWLVAQFLRMIMTGERWPMTPIDPGGIIPPARLARARALLSTMIFYVLIALGSHALAGVAAQILPSMGFEAKGNVTPQQQSNAGLMMVIFIALLLNFRWLWLHVALVCGLSVSHFHRATRPFILNIQLAAIWIATIVPILLAAMILLAAFEPLAHGDGVVPSIVFLVLALFNVAAQTLLAMASSTAIALTLTPLLAATQPRH